jgi:hypothetical protein
MNAMMKTEVLVCAGLVVLGAAACASWGRPRSLGYKDYARLYGRLAAGKTAADLEDAIPGLRGRLASAAEISRRWWTDSTPGDELAHEQILPDDVLDALGIPHRVDGGVEHVPAGLMHTYGYVFAQVKTAYGLKGKRWIESRVDERLGLPAGTFSPNPPEGEFLANLTATLARLVGLPADVPGALKTEPNARALGAVEERVRWRRPDGAAVVGVVRTHLVALGPARGLKTADTHLLIYELELGGERRFVTAFPIESAFARTFLDAKPADDAAFKPRFNLYVDPSWTVFERRSAGFVPAPR